MVVENEQLLPGEYVDVAFQLRPIESQVDDAQLHSFAVFEARDLTLDRQRKVIELGPSAGD